LDGFAGDLRNNKVALYFEKYQRMMPHQSVDKYHNNLTIKEWVLSMKFVKLFFLTFLLFLIVGCVNQTTKSIAVKNVLCEYAENPINVDSSRPRFSWTLESSLRGQKQTAFQVLVATNEAHLKKEIGDAWDSGKVESDQSGNVLYDGMQLQSNRTYYWKVRVWERDGVVSKYSKTAKFGIALLDAKEWQAHWIGTGSPKEPRSEKGYFDNITDPATTDIQADEGSTLLRKTFEFDKPIKNARLYVCGLGYYELSLNGQRIGEHVLNPAKTNYRKQILYDTYDVTNDLNSGANAVGIHLGNGWFNPPKKWWSWRMQWFGAKRAIFQLHIEFEDGSTKTFISDDSWKTAPGPIVKSCIYDGEIYDANLVKQGWNQSNFDDSAWENVKIVEAPGGEMISQMMEPIKVIETLKPVALENPEPGVYVYDMGQNFSGWARLKVKGAKGDTIVLAFAENKLETGKIDTISNNKAKTTDTFILNGTGTEIFEPTFTFHGFRYVQMTGFPGEPTIDNLEGRVVHSDVEPVGHFTCSDAEINHIHKCTLWSQKSNLMGIPTDCPQRDERLGWLGDAHVTAEEAMLNFHMPLFYKNWLSGIQSNRNVKTGDICYISPRPHGELGTPAWSSGYLLIIWYYYLQYNDTQIVAEHFDTMKQYVDLLHSRAKKYILPHDRYGDWVSVVKDWDRGKPESVATAYLYYDATIVSEAAKLLGLSDDALYYANLAEKIKAAYNRRFFDPKTNQYESGTQMSNAFPLFLDIVPENHKDAVLQNLVDDITIKNRGHVTTGILGTKYMIEALTNNGRTDVAYQLVKQKEHPGWLDMIKNRTTLSERWTLRGSNNHVMFGSIDTWFYRILAGINIDDAQPGFEHIFIKPVIPEDLSFVDASLQTIRGKVSSRWDVSDGDVRLRIVIPVNSSATVYVPAQDKESITESGQLAETSQGVKFIKTEKQYAVFRVGSGEYDFTSKGIQNMLPKLDTDVPK
jgi:alpha-L-rhamnosidase